MSLLKRNRNIERECQDADINQAGNKKWAK